MMMVLDPVRADADLAAGGVPCGGCGRSLAPWGWARPRRVTLPGGRSLQLRPRRARCPGCGATHVLLPASALPRASAATELVGQVVMDAAAGAGHRTIAARHVLPESTVRRWLRRLRANAERLRCRGTTAAFALDPQQPPLRPQGSPLADAVEALASAASAAVRRFGPLPVPWPLIAVIAGGLLLAPPTG
jgi:hypothetical protein